MKTRRPILASVVLLVLVFMQGQAGAEFYTGNELVGRMHAFDMREAGSPAKDVSWLDVGLYVGFIIGVYDSLGGILWERAMGTTQGQIAAVVAKYLKFS